MEQPTDVCVLAVDKVLPCCPPSILPAFHSSKHKIKCRFKIPHTNAQLPIFKPLTSFILPDHLTPADYQTHSSREREQHHDEHLIVQIHPWPPLNCTLRSLHFSSQQLATCVGAATTCTPLHWTAVLMCPPVALPVSDHLLVGTPLDKLK